MPAWRASDRPVARITIEATLVPMPKTKAAVATHVGGIPIADWLSTVEKIAPAIT